MDIFKECEKQWKEGERERGREREREGEILYEKGV
jgi:hypothetical protein